MPASLVQNESILAIDVGATVTRAVIELARAENATLSRVASDFVERAMGVDVPYDILDHA